MPPISSNIRMHLERERTQFLLFGTKARTIDMSKIRHGCSGRKRDMVCIRRVARSLKNFTPAFPIIDIRLSKTQLKLAVFFNITGKQNFISFTQIFRICRISLISCTHKEGNRTPTQFLVFAILHDSAKLTDSILVITRPLSLGQLHRALTGSTLILRISPGPATFTNQIDRIMGRLIIQEVFS